MGIDDNDLTFVRCPSCSCLIPAIASRCRMCGQDLNADNSESKPSEDSEDSSKSRIRQRVATNHVNVTPKNLDSSSSESSDKTPVYQSKRLDDALKEKLGSSIEEIFTDDKSVQSESAQKDLVKKSGEESGQGKIDKFFADKEPSSQSETKKGDKQAFASVESSKEEIESTSVKSPFKSKSPEKDDLSLPKEEKLSQEVKSKAFNQNLKKDKPKKTNFENKGRSEQKSSNKLGTEKAETEGKEFTWEASSDSDKKSQGALKSVNSKPKSSSEQVSKSNKNKKSFSLDKKKQNSHKDKGNSMQQGRKDKNLVGWFVDFKNSFGTAIELREGRYFVSSEAVKGEDLVIKNNSISVPHCILKAHPSDGLRVQDLMSEKGTFIKKPGEHDYRKIEDSIVVEHGDWLKLGEYEVMVCIIPSYEKSSNEVEQPKA